MNDYKISNRKRQHIQNTHGKVFLPQSRMREIRWEESVRYSQLKREGDDKEQYCIERFDCSCGYIGCLGQPIIRKLV